MERHFDYPAEVEQDSAGFYLVTFPDFPEAATDARSPEAALSEATDCLEEAVAGRWQLRRAAVTGSERLASKHQPLTLSASRETR